MMHRRVAVLFGFCALFGLNNAQAQTLLVQPYLQSLTPTSVWIVWETDTGTTSQVDWGLTADALDQSGEGTSQPHRSARLHKAQLTNLNPGTTYHYRVSTGDAQSDTGYFYTPQPPDAEASINFVAMSDMQIDNANPNIFREIVHDGVLPYMLQHTGEESIAKALSMALIPGDLVSDGENHGQWRDHFFGPSATLFAHVPVYPVPGNHERDSDLFFSYFHLPENGTEGFEEHWWFHDLSNIRVIGLDSNPGYRIEGQLNWLDNVLEDACGHDDIDFVFAQLHHPHLSELWLAGETDYTGEVIDRLERFSSECGKPSVHFFGHTHGYSRGQSRDHNHLWVNVASAGGNIDYWGEYPQNDYDIFTISQDEWGFVHVEVEAGDTPTFRLRRLSQGNEMMRYDNTISDEIVIRRNMMRPITPEPLSPTSTDHNPDCLEFKASPFDDPESQTHQGSHWQIAAACDDFDAPVLERWSQSENWYAGINTQAGDDLTDARVDSNLNPDTTYCWRVRYRSSGLVWSLWSSPVPFTTGQSQRTPNLVRNPGAEASTEGWTGQIESLAAGECDGVTPYAGEHYFAVGGVCDNESDAGEATQSINVAAHANNIDSGTANAVLSGYLRNFGGNDTPSFQLLFRDAQDNASEPTPPTQTQSTSWTRLTHVAPIPPGTRTIEVVLRGIRNSGTDNDSYFDDLDLRIDFRTEDQACETPDLPDTGTNDAGTDSADTQDDVETNPDTSNQADTSPTMDASDPRDTSSEPDTPPEPDVSPDLPEDEPDSTTTQDTTRQDDTHTQDNPPSNDDGCGCRVHRSNPPTHGALLVFGALLVWGLRLGVRNR